MILEIPLLDRKKGLRDRIKLVSLPKAYLTGTVSSQLTTNVGLALHSWRKSRK